MSFLVKTSSHSTIVDRPPVQPPVQKDHQQNQKPRPATTAESLIETRDLSDEMPPRLRRHPPPQAAEISALQIENEEAPLHDVQMQEAVSEPAPVDSAASAAAPSEVQPEDDGEARLTQPQQHAYKKNLLKVELVDLCVVSPAHSIAAEPEAAVPSGHNYKRFKKVFYFNFTELSQLTQPSGPARVRRHPAEPSDWPRSAGNQHREARPRRRVRVEL